MGNPSGEWMESMQRLLVHSNDVEAFLAAFIKRNGQAPLIREIANGLSASPATVCKMLEKLERCGRIRRSPGPRGIELPQPAFY